MQMTMGYTSNILNKVDQSRLPISNNTHLTKREHYEWADAGKIGTFKMIDKKLLNIDGSYQRNEVSRDKTLEIARKWDWKLFGALSVVRRADGSLWVYDGGHRTRAAFKRDDITALPCMIHESHGLVEEATAFLGTNTMASNVTAIQKFRASLCAKEPIAVATQAILSQHGYNIANTAHSRCGTQAIGTLVRMVKQDRDLAARVFAVCTEIAEDGEQIPSATMRGLFHLAKRMAPKLDVLSNGHREALIRTGIRGIEGVIRQHMTRLGRGGELVAAQAIFEILNKGRKRRISWVD